MGGETAITMATLISDYLQPLFTQVITNIGTIVTTVTGSPFLMLTVAMMFTGVMFKFLRKLLGAY